ncbi:MAG: aminotransferase class I/II-fold pyridoxal phosphate-dependent enzyme [Bacteroidetes bacterium]|nr:aminotransferase class I/II-fold pyridoxal phosphate-dependent enzyme [Bacteroidota bacterium]HET6244794.1 GntG family PLP-dependent aldolase [Bacteroidia bacterium]
MNSIDLRSDTVTKPGKAMLEAMFNARVGDDVFEEDEAVNQLEQQSAQMFGMEAGLFCPSGTMTNQIGIKILTQPGDEVICDALSHIYNYEGGGISFNSSASVKLIHSFNGIFNAENVIDNINPDNVHYPKSSLVSIENTSNRGGGCCWNIENVRQIAEVCKQNKLYFHLDGARIFNALAHTGESAKDYGKLFDTISVCLSKGLGAPAGSVLLANKELIKKARRIRKVLGGGMRQAGYLAAAGTFALDNNIERLKQDHLKAKILEQCIKALPFVEEVFPVQTNIVVFKLIDAFKTDSFIDKLGKKGIKVVAFGKQTIRMVTHLDINDSEIDRTITELKKLEIN